MKTENKMWDGCIADIHNGQLISFLFSYFVKPTKSVLSIVVNSEQSAEDPEDSEMVLWEVDGEWCFLRGDAGWK